MEIIAKQAAKNIKSESDLNDFRQMLTKITAEAALNAELDEHLGYQKPEITAKLIILLWNCPYISTFRLT